MSMNEYLIYGYGGHAIVISEGVKLIGGIVNGYFDDDKSENFKNSFISSYNPNHFPNSPVLIAIGNNEIRMRVSRLIKHNYGVFIHPKAIIAEGVEIGEGTVVLAGAVIQPGVKIGKHVIINANVVLDHGSVINNFCSIYPNSYIGSNTVLCEGVTINACTSIQRNSILNHWTTVG